MGSNPHWFAQQRAKGICYLCKRKMDDSDPKQAHTECRKLQCISKKTFKEIQEIMRMEDAKSSR